MRRTIKYTLLKKNPYEKWNQFVDLIVNESYDDLTQDQRVAQLSFVFDAEMQNGGIIQYFTNCKGEYLEETLEALSSLGADRQRTSLLKAMNLFTTLNINNVENRDEFIKEAMVRYDYEFESFEKEEGFEEFIEGFDQGYYSIIPSITELLEKYLDENEDEFIEIEDDR